MQNIVLIGVGFPDAVSIIEDVNSARPTYRLLGFLDDDPEKGNQSYLGYGVLGSLEWILSNPEVEVINTIARDLSVRSKINNRLRDYGAKFASLVHPTVKTDHAHIGNGVIIGKNVYLEPRVSIGAHTMVLPNSTVGHDSVIGENCFLAPGSHLLGHVTLGKHVFVGAGAVVYPDVVVQDEAMLGINAAVTMNVDNGVTLSASPSRKIPRR